MTHRRSPFENTFQGCPDWTLFRRSKEDRSEEDCEVENRGRARTKGEDADGQRESQGGTLPVSAQVFGRRTQNGIDRGRTKIVLSLVDKKPRRILGQAGIPLAAPPSTSPSGSQRIVQVTSAEGKLISQMADNIVAFSENYPIEFMSYCPPERWEKALKEIGTWKGEIDRRVKDGAATVNVPADAVFHLIDLEKCISAARDTRLRSAQWAFGLAAAGTIANVVFGLSWITVPTYIGGIAILLGGPLLAKYSAKPQEPYKSVLSGRRVCLSGPECEMIAMKLQEEEKANPDRRKVLERVVVSPTAKIQRHHWGTVTPRPGSKESAVCLSKGRFRVRVEGWAQDLVVPTGEWDFCDPEDCNGNIILAVWTSDRDTGRTGWGAVSEESGHEDTYWVEYVGPYTEGKTRKAGPFGCTGDPVEHAMDDAGFKRRGVDGDYRILDRFGATVAEEEAA